MLETQDIFDIRSGYGLSVRKAVDLLFDFGYN